MTGRGLWAGGMCIGLLATLHGAGAAGVWQGPGGGIAFAIAVAPAAPGTVYVGTGRGGIFESRDSGRTWRRLTRSRRLGRIMALAADGAGTVYASDARGRLLASTDGGVEWRVADTGAGPAEILSLAIDRRPRPDAVYAGTSAGEVRRSADGGRTWTGGGIGVEQPVLSLAVDPRRRRGVVWAGTTAGVFRSADGGVTWARRATLAVRELVVDPTGRGTLFAAHEGVFRSADGGRTWRRIPDIRYALSLAVDSRTGAVYAGTSHTSVLKSLDGGTTWSKASAGLPPLGEVIDLAIDTRTRPSTLYAATSSLGVYRSTDGGASWRADDAPAPATPTAHRTAPGAGRLAERRAQGIAACGSRPAGRRGDTDRFRRSATAANGTIAQNSRRLKDRTKPQSAMDSWSARRRMKTG